MSCTVSVLQTASDDGMGQSGFNGGGCAKDAVGWLRMYLANPALFAICRSSRAERLQTGAWMDTLADMASDIASDPVVLQDGVLCLRFDGRTVPLRMGAAPVESFIPGWRPVFLYTGFPPFVLLQFSSDAGETAIWIVDADGVRLGGSLGELEPGAQEALRVAAVPRVVHWVDAVLQQPTLSPDSQARAFLRLPEDFRRDVGQLCAASALPPVRRVVLEGAPDLWEEGWGLDRGHVETLLAMPFQDRLLRAAEDGMLSWPSPVDGRTLRVQGSLCSDDFRFAYRLADPTYGLVYYPIVSHHHAATLGLYVPALNLLLVRDGWAAGWMDVYAPSVTDWLIPPICRFGDRLEGYFSAGVSRIVSIMRGWPSNHLGHQLWNELSGIHRYLRSASGSYLPEWIVPGLGTELWGPIDQVFPQLHGRVDRSASSVDAAVRASYDTGACLVRITSEHVSAGLRASLQRLVEADPVHGEVRRVITGRARPEAPVILIGLRVENRTMVDLLDFCEELLVRVAATFPGAILVLDGHNSGPDGQVIVSHGELGARRPPIEVERQVVTHLRRLQAGRDVTVVDTLGAPIRASLAWCAQAHCFFSVWGASLAKYRWACNKPGLVVTSRWNLTHRTDLHIYDAPEFMEAPSELAFVDAHLIQDMPSAALTVDVGPGQPSFFNFNAETEAIISQFFPIIDNFLACSSTMSSSS